MVGQKVNVRNKKKKVKRFFKWFAVVTVTIVVVFAIYYTASNIFFDKTESERVVVENPLKGLVVANTNDKNEVDVEKVVEQAVLEFDEGYINFILYSLEIDELHKSPLNLENPLIEIDVGEVWSSELVKGVPQTEEIPIDNEDIRIIMDKEEAVNALLSEDISVFMEESVIEGDTQIELVAGKIELFNKGYLSMYKEITGSELDVE